VLPHPVVLNVAFLEGVNLKVFGRLGEKLKIFLKKLTWIKNKII